MLTFAKHIVTIDTDASHEEHISDWSHQVSAMATTQGLQRDQILPLCKGCGLQD